MIADRARRRIVTVLTSIVVASIAACASTPVIEGVNSGGERTFGGDDSGKGSFGSDGGPSGPGGLGPEQEACAEAFSESTVKPVNLVFMYDESQSMTQPTGVQGVDKWAAAKQGVSGFVADPASAGLSAVIEFFSGPAVGQMGPLCDVATYSTAVAGPIPLPDTGGIIAGAINSRAPNGGTATLYAMRGARQIASTVLAQRPNERAAIVLVTDGIPDGCSFENSVEETAKVAAQSLAADAPVFVIGVGNSLGTLNAIAKSGGTSAAYIVDPNGDVSAALLAALAKIRGKVASCVLAIPEPPDGKTIDIDAVNVGYGGKTLSYSKDCASGEGWHYDNATPPKAIELCPATCEDVKKTAAAKVSVAFGCATKGGVVR